MNRTSRRRGDNLRISIPFRLFLQKGYACLSRLDYMCLCLLGCVRMQCGIWHLRKRCCWQLAKVTLRQVVASEVHLAKGTDPLSFVLPV